MKTKIILRFTSTLFLRSNRNAAIVTDFLTKKPKVNKANLFLYLLRYTVLALSMVQLNDVSSSSYCNIKILACYVSS